MGRVGFRGRTRRYAFLLVRARSGAGGDGATLRRRPACVIFWQIFSAIASSRSRSVRLCAKNARSVTSGQEATGLYRGLVAARPEAFTPKLAGSLNTLAKRLWEFGRHQEALVASQKATDLYRMLAQIHP
jgi:hypothetical protein